MKVSDAERILRSRGFLLARYSNGGHKIWKHPDTGEQISLTTHGDISGFLKQLVMKGSKAKGVFNK